MQTPSLPSSFAGRNGNRPPLLTLAVALALLAIGGCGGPTGNSASTINDFQAGVFRAQCDWQQRCGGIGASELQRCYDNYNVVSEGPVDFAALVAGRRVAFDSGAASRCLDTLQAATCGSFFGGFGSADCLGAATGLVMPGDACTSDLECAGGYCTSLDEGCAGKCVVWPAPGAACTSLEGCGSTASCDGQSHTCKARLPAGSACLASNDCQSGLRCATDAMGMNGKCATYGTAGAPCSPGAVACAGGFYCDTASKTCKPQRERGAACTGLSDCKSGLGCVGHLPQMPGSMGTCGPLLDAGQACVPGSVGCPGDMPCDPATRTCKARGTAGASCVSDNDCDLASYCDGATKKCAAWVVYGAACTPAIGGSSDPCAIGSCENASKRCLVQCP